MRTDDPGRGLRWWASRLGLALLAPLVFLLALEGAVRVFWGPIEYPLPGLDEAARYLYFTMPERFSPLFELRQDEDGPHLATREELHTGSPWFVREQRFPARRAPNAIRVAFLGGSSVQGWPWRADGVVFPELVGQALEERYPELEVDVINAGVGTYSSFQLVEVAWQLTALKPDVVVIYAGHNDRGYYFFGQEFLDGILTDGLPRRGLVGHLNRLHFYRGARMLRDRWFGRPSSPVLDRAVQPFLPQDAHDSMVGVDDELFLERVRLGERYLPRILASNLAEAIDLFSDGTEVVLALPTSNLRDFPPHFSIFGEPLDEPDRRRFEELLTQAAERMDDENVEPRVMPSIWGDGSRMHAWRDYPLVVDPDAPALGSPEARRACEEPLALLRQALAVDDGHALAWYLVGTCLIHSDPDAARLALVRARDLSPAMAPNQRAGSDLVEAMAALGRERGLPVVDLPRAFADAAELGVPDGTLFIDNLHFSVRGHQVAAGALVDALAELPIVRDGPPASRPVDPEPAETVLQMEVRRITAAWGLGLPAPGLPGSPEVESEEEAPAGDLREESNPQADDAPYMDETGVHDRPGHEMTP